ncbi:MAG: hypothetical protein ACRBF0_22625 [Calditrichia bacterium]
MNANSHLHILMNVHKIGLPITGTVSRIIEQPHSKSHNSHLPEWAKLPELKIDVDSPFHAKLPAHRLANTPEQAGSVILPKVGESIITIVENFVNDTLILSARPNELSKESIASWKHYHDFINYLELGQEIEGTVLRSEPFGLFININGPGMGIIDVALMKNLPGTPLPANPQGWPQSGDKITVCVNGFRLGNKQVEVGWVS